MPEAIAIVVIGIAALAVGALVGYNLRLRIRQGQISAAEGNAARILAEAQTRQKEILLEAKEEAIRTRGSGRDRTAREASRASAFRTASYPKRREPGSQDRGAGAPRSIDLLPRGRDRQDKAGATGATPETKSGDREGLRPQQPGGARYPPRGDGEGGARGRQPSRCARWRRRSRRRASSARGTSWFRRYTASPPTWSPSPPSASSPSPATT